MVKNESKNLERCLKSLEGLLASPDIELIIVDTGSEDNTVDIAKNYTAKIYYHMWNNNFSEMRNISISYALGEWILILDADEQIENPQELLKLINSKDLKKANTYQFTMRDYVRESDEKKFVTYSSYRLFQNDGQFGYTGAVHNQPKIKAPILSAPVIINHFGYQFDNKELLERKFKRTSAILLNELEKDPDNIYYRYQLANSYFIHDDFAEAFEEIKISYKLISALTPIERGNHAYVYAEYGRSAFVNKAFSDGIGVCEEGIKLKPDYVDLYFYCAVAHQAMGEESKALEYALKYLELMNRYDTLKIAKDPAIIMLCADQRSLQTMHTIAATKYYKDKNYEQAFIHANHMDNTQDKADIYIDICFILKEFVALKTYLLGLDIKEKETLLFKTEQLYQQSLGDIKQLYVDEFLVGSDDYAMLNKIRKATGELELILTKEFIKKCDFNVKPIYFAEIFKHFSRDQKEILHAFKKMKNSQIKLFIQHLLTYYTPPKEEIMNYLLSERVRPTDYEGNRVISAIANVLILNEIEVSKEKGIENRYYRLFDKYVECSICRMNLIYQMNKMRLYYKTLDEAEDQFIVLVQFAAEASEKGSYQAAVKYLKEAVYAYPFMASIMSEFENRIFGSL